jgi:hypothetical protein
MAPAAIAEAAAPCANPATAEARSLDAEAADATAAAVPSAPPPQRRGATAATAAPVEAAAALSSAAHTLEHRTVDSTPAAMGSSASATPRRVDGGDEVQLSSSTGSHQRGARCNGQSAGVSFIARAKDAGPSVSDSDHLAWLAVVLLCSRL